MTDYKYSIDEEFYPYDSIEEAIQSFYDENGELLTEVYRGIPIKYSIKNLIPSYVAEGIIDNAYDEAGEFTENWANDFILFEKEFNKALEDAAEKFCDDNNCQPSFFTIMKPEVFYFKVESIEPEVKYTIVKNWEKT